MKLIEKIYLITQKNWVKKNMPNKSTCQAAAAVMKNTDKFSPAVVKMANYANNFGCKAK